MCTDSARCYCHAGYVGNDCSVRLPQTAVNVIALDTSPSTISTQSWIELITVSGIPASNIMVTLPSVALGEHGVSVIVLNNLARKCYAIVV